MSKREKDDFERNCRLGRKSKGYTDLIFGILSELNRDGFTRNGKRLTFRETERIAYRVFRGMVDNLDTYKDLTIPNTFHIVKYGDDEKYYYAFRDKRKPRR